MKKTRC